MDQDGFPQSFAPPVLDDLISVVFQVPVDFELLKKPPYSGYDSSPSPRPHHNNISACRIDEPSRARDSKMAANSFKLGLRGEYPRVLFIFPSRNQPRELSRLGKRPL